MTDSDPLIRMEDVTRAGHCGSGARRWFEAYGFDFRAFIRDGLPASTLLATGDAFAQRVVTMRLEKDAANG